MPAESSDLLVEAVRGALRSAAPPPRAPVDPGPVLRRGRRLALRRRAARTALVLLLLLPASGALVGRLASPRVDLAAGGPPVPALLPAQEEPPRVLADGRAPGAVPAAVAARFDEPVVAARRRSALPEDVRERCATPPLALAGSHAPDLGARQQRLADRAGDAVVHVGPAATTALATGDADAPPGYPQRYGASCIARPTGEGNRSAGVHVEHLTSGWTGYAEAAPGTEEPSLWTTALAVPGGATWAVQEQPGWWLAYDVRASAWLLAQTARAAPQGAGAPMFPGVRVVFLDGDGRTVGEERLTSAIPPDAPYSRSQATTATIHLGPEEDLRAALAGGPVPACAPQRTVCVWVVDAGGELLALSAASPLPAEVPPFGFVGWCPAEGAFAESQLGSRFALDGTRLRGPAPGDLNRYAVVVADGEVRVDLSRFSFGAERGGEVDAQPGQPASCSRLEEPGFRMG